VEMRKYRNGLEKTELVLIVFMRKSFFIVNSRCVYTVLSHCQEEEEEEGRNGEQSSLLMSLGDLFFWTILFYVMFYSLHILRMNSAGRLR